LNKNAKPDMQGKEEMDLIKADGTNNEDQSEDIIRCLCCCIRHSDYDVTTSHHNRVFFTDVSAGPLELASGV
jgi:hypothetical protein